MNKKTILGIAVIALMAIVAFTACSKSGGGSSGGGGKSLNSATELREYLDKQPANSPAQPIKVAMKANDMMIKDIAEVIKNAGKYVSLDLSGSPLTEIPDRAFYECKTLASITIPNSVTSIGYLFWGCTSLTSITVDSGNTNYASEGGILYNKAKTEIVRVPEGISGNVTIPNGVTDIGVMAFANCTSLTSITIPSSITSIGDAAFSDCTSLTSITIPNSVTSIGEWAFGNCTSLTSVTFEGTIASAQFATNQTFYGDLREKYLAGGIGTYTTTAPVDYYSKWTKQ